MPVLWHFLFGQHWGSHTLWLVRLLFISCLF